ncbi:MAG TPA: hypothetical protein VGQ83_26125 [Polyangia bacterium]|jgi:hypothetical protein
MKVRVAAVPLTAWLGVSLLATLGCGNVITGANVNPDAGTDAPAPTDGPPAGRDGGGCGLRTCATVGANCGPIGDGCGGVLDCGTCPAGQECGVNNQPNVCGATICTPRTCAQLGATCGPAGDGCGGVLDCGACTPPATCGGGGVHSQCGNQPPPTDGGVNPCVPRTCAQQGVGCGPAGDGCGGALDCGGCAPPQACGGGGTPSQCGTPATPCVPKTCAQAAVGCGPGADGCGGLLDCGSCTLPQTCGGAGTPSQCGTPPSVCVPKTCAAAGANCGPLADGCGGLLQCGTCPSGQLCGANAHPNVCGGTTCTPRTCAQQGATCGPVGDGCGGLTASCGTCASPLICGGGGVPSVCGSNVTPDGGTCTNLCLQQVGCDGGSTTITGTVYAPTDPARGFGDPDPLYNAIVYVPNAPVQPFTPGVSCDSCGAPLSGAPLVQTESAVDGTFTLANAPCGANIPLVIQVGRWRRQITIDSVACCARTTLTAEQTRLPRNRFEGDIPLFAIDTGNVDVIECVLRKMGIEDSEFANPNLVGGVPQSPQRVHFYQANPTTGHGGAVIDANTPHEGALFGSQTTLNAYDVVIFACEGGRDREAVAAQQRVINYANVGGRVFASHYSYVWLDNIAPWSATAAWNIDAGRWGGPLDGYIDTSFPKGQALADWLQQPAVGASTVWGQIPVREVRHDFDSVVAPAQRWMYTQAPDPAMPIHYTFNTPWGTPPANQCGRVVYSDFHVENHSGSLDMTFHSECTDGPLTPQEKLLEFMLYDITACITPDIPTCTPRTCAQAGFNCGQAGDGCGGIITCGVCPPPQVCGGGGTPNVCGVATCAPRTCAQLGVGCGPAGDGCGGTLNCGPCTPPDTCGGGGTPGVCGHAPCTAWTCAQQGLLCGPAGDGCGGLLDCGPCTPPDTCGGGGTPGVCGHPPCTARTCAQQGISCGPAGDGCGGLLACGPCTPPDTCGGGGTPGVCGHTASCAPLTCAQQGLGCGPAGDGCGGLLDCGPCTSPDTCGGGGTPGVCGHAPCTPVTCTGLGKDCGPMADGCGAIIDCGTCAPPLTCGGGGVANVCGMIG